jgi:hypothetical protein
MLSETIGFETGEKTVLRTGTVLSVSGKGLTLEAGGEILAARKAPGCLPDPREDDTVLFVEVEGWGAVVMTVLLSGPEESPRTMSFPGGVHLTSDGEIGMESPRFRGVFSDCSVSARTLTLAGDLLALAGRKISEVGQILERVGEWIFERSGSSVREVEGVDRQRAGAVEIASESVVSVSSRSTLLTSAELVKIDSDQVHLG